MLPRHKPQRPDPTATKAAIATFSCRCRSAWSDDGVPAQARDLATSAVNCNLRLQSDYCLAARRGACRMIKKTKVATSKTKRKTVKKKPLTQREMSVAARLDALGLTRE